MKDMQSNAAPAYLSLHSFLTLQDGSSNIRSLVKERKIEKHEILTNMLRVCVCVFQRNWISVKIVIHFNLISHQILKSWISGICRIASKFRGIKHMY